MNPTDEKYDRLLHLLRKSKPEAPWYNLMEDEIMKRISGKPETAHGIFDFIFGWIYIGWVRRSLIALSFVLLGFFLWQQNNILKEVNELGKKVSASRMGPNYDPAAALEKKQMLLKLSREKTGNIVIRQEDLTMLLDSLKNLNVRYRDLLDLVNEYPELKKVVEENLQKNLQSRIKL
jgi:hypothetical protein